MVPVPSLKAVSCILSLALLFFSSTLLSSAHSIAPIQETLKSTSFLSFLRSSNMTLASKASPTCK